MPDAVVLVDGRGRGVRANRQFVRLFGYSQEEIVDADLSSLINSSQICEEAPHLQRYRNLREGTAATQSVCIRKGGERFQISLIEGLLLTGKPASRYMICLGTCSLNLKSRGQKQNAFVNDLNSNREKRIDCGCC